MFCLVALLYSLPQAYPLPETVQANPQLTLPQPASRLCPLPAGTIQVPFRFKLPEKLPPSVESSRKAFVRYSIYSTIQVKYRKDPSTRALFTVLTHNPMEFMPPRPLQPIHGTCENQPLPPLCCGLIKRRGMEGSVTLIVSTTQRGFAPGETIPLDIQIINNSLVDSKVEFRVVRHFTAEGLTADRQSHWSQEVCKGPVDESDHLVAAHGEKRYFIENLTLPAICPTFRGSGAKWMEDVRWLIAYPRGERFATAEGQKGHSLTWRDVIEVSALSPRKGLSVSLELEITILAWPLPHTGSGRRHRLPLQPGPVADEGAERTLWQDQPATPGADMAPAGLLPSGMVVVYVEDPQGAINVGHPIDDEHCFNPSGLVWAPLCPLSKPEAWPIESSWRSEANVGPASELPLAPAGPCLTEPLSVSRQQLPPLPLQL
eukprot:CAMPEP_0117670548 /NCGR_PEP_ID=MMETSP0804-20121206/12826_1 /TAXON_ID=1074897 /ORGANISM="Tetraselmis astigmatica, Strain CCMP880" /LENGTH=430 /DNA_ID=CAMNT_0005478883 /DNA_START=241 /DNA_END=1533 /DNA_ORIENTATION=-